MVDPLCMFSRTGVIIGYNDNDSTNDVSKDSYIEEHAEHRKHKFFSTKNVGSNISKSKYRSPILEIYT